jgi:hypothetical protein
MSDWLMMHWIALRVCELDWQIGLGYVCVINIGSETYESKS